MSSGEWYWCLEHKAAEPADSACPPDRRHWKERVDSRNEEWEAADRAWDGDD